MNKILAGLFIGSVRDSKDHQQLKANSITHILSIHDTAKPGTFQDVQYHCISASDSISQNLVPFFAQCNDFIHSARLSGGNVLIHCLAGVSRSVAIVIAYLMSITTLSYKEVLDAIRDVRSISDPNPAFQRQLQDFETFKRKNERNRLYYKFLNDIPRMTDETELKKMIVHYRTVGQKRSSINQSKSSTLFANLGRRQSLIGTTTTTTTSSSSTSSGNQSHNNNNSNTTGSNSSPKSNPNLLIFYTPKLPRRRHYNATGGKVPTATPTASTTSLINRDIF